MPSRRQLLATCSAGLCLAAGCLGRLGAPDIPRETRVLDERATIEPGAYQAWSLADRIADTPFSTDEKDPIFSYEFVVEDGPAVLVAVTTGDEVERRAETDGRYRTWAGTRAEGERGALSEQMAVEFLDVLVVDNQYIGEGTPEPGRSSATVRVQAYLSRQQPN